MNYTKKIKLNRTIICLILIISILLMSFTNSFAIAGIDDVVLYTVIGLVGVACGLSLVSATDIQEVGRQLYLTMTQVVSDLGDLSRELAALVTQYLNTGRVVVSSFIYNIMQEVSRVLGLDQEKVSSVNVVNVNNTVTNTTYSNLVKAVESANNVTAQSLPSYGQSVFNYMINPTTVARPFPVDYKTTVYLLINGINYAITRHLTLNAQYITNPYAGNFSQLELSNVQTLTNLSTGVTTTFLNDTFSKNFTVVTGEYLYTGLYPNLTRYYATDISSIINGYTTPYVSGTESLTVSVDSALNQVTLSSKLAGLSSQVSAPLQSLATLDISSLESVINAGRNAVIPVVNTPSYNPLNPQPNNDLTLGIGSSIVYANSLLIYDQVTNRYKVNPSYSAIPLDVTSVIPATGTITASPGVEGNASLNIPVLGGILDVLQSIYQWLQQLWEKIVAFFTQLIGDAVGTIVTAIEGEIQSISQDVANFKNTFDGYIDFIGQYQSIGGLFSHFLPQPAAQFCWICLELIFVIFIIKIVLAL